jgi:type I restriction enzyme M protein
MEDANLSGAYGCLRDTTADILFLAQNLRLLRKHGKVGIIVPDGIVTGKRHSGLRRELVTSHTIESVTRLPRTAFNGTDAQAFILTITKGKPTVGPILLNEIDFDGTLSSPVFVAADEAHARLDYGYYALRQKQKRSVLTLGELSAFVFRGQVSSSQRLQGRAQHFHTTDFPVGNERLSFSIPKQFRVDASKLKHEAAIATPGDILLARVGRNLEEKVCLISSGTAAVTDCVYIIRARAENRHKIINSLMSGVGKRWLQELAHGVGARQLPKTDLLKLPI